MKGILTCPECKSQEEMKIPMNACIPFYICKKCKKEIKAKDGCCIFCDYGNKPCPISHK